MSMEEAGGEVQTAPEFAPMDEDFPRTQSGHFEESSPEPPKVTLAPAVANRTWAQPTPTFAVIAQHLQAMPDLLHAHLPPAMWDVFSPSGAAEAAERAAAAQAADQMDVDEQGPLVSYDAADPKSAEAMEGTTPPTTRLCCSLSTTPPSASAALALSSGKRSTENDTDSKRRRHSPVNPFDPDSDGDAREGIEGPSDEPGLVIKPERAWSLERNDEQGHQGAAIKTEATDGDDTESEWNGISDDDELRANRTDVPTTTDPKVASEPAMHTSF
ncbi:MAG: hypothetical protein M1826_000107 [Phylliscum demangeonii]|nr:MAG: hypothetical protein M1826_000107 [Phylliscum demangeonii]